MSSQKKLAVAAAALSGLIAGSAARAATVPSSHGSGAVTKAGVRASTLDDSGNKHDCKGQNSCKGQGGCKTGDNGCKGKNSCKGRGGCQTNGKGTFIALRAF